MSQIQLADVKRFLRVIGTADDAMLEELIAGAEQEACRFLGRSELPTLPLEYPAESSSEEVPSSEDPVVADVRVAVMHLVQSKYEATKPEDQAKLRAAAEVILAPYRTGLGV